MDALQMLTAAGGNDLLGAYIYSIHSDDAITVVLTGTQGGADITANGLTCTATFVQDLKTTADNFVSDFTADYAAIGITIGSLADGEISFMGPGSTGKVIDVSIVNDGENASDLSGTLEDNGGRLPHPISSFIVSTTAVINYATYRDNNGVEKPLVKRFIGQSLPAGTLIVFEFPVVVISINSGTIITNYTK